VEFAQHLLDHLREPLGSPVLVDQFHFARGTSVEGAHPTSTGGECCVAGCRTHELDRGAAAQWARGISSSVACIPGSGRCHDFTSALKSVFLYEENDAR
jgi:hypothetical protein